MLRARSSEVSRGWMKAMRVIVGLVFIGTGWLKLSGHNIRDGFGTPHGVDPVMPLFNAMFAVPMYWRFLGAGQLVGGLLLLTSRTAALGAVVCAPIIANIAVLIFALPFATADRVAVVLLAAAHASLLAWEWPRLSALIGPVGAESSVTAAVVDAWSRRWVRLAAGAGLAAFVGVHVLLLVRSR